MAYRPRRRASGYRARSYSPRRTSYRRGPARRTSSRRRASSGSRTVRIEIVQGGAQPIARPPIVGQKQAAGPKQAKF